MRIAITGGAGFLGRAAVDAAENAGHDVWTFDLTDGNDVLGDLSDLTSADAVIHLAGMLGTSELFDTAEAAVDVNVKGTLRILDWCRDNDARYVGITMLHVFPSVYTATKVCAQRLASAWHQAFDLPVSHVRAFNAYGPHQAHGPGHPQKILPTFATEAWAGRPIPVWGDGEQTVDLVHADDVGRMLIDAIGHGDDAVFDAGTGIPRTVNQVAHDVLEVTGSTAGIKYLPMRPGEVPVKVVAQGDGWDRLTWRPEMNWQKFSEAVQWYR